ncbi:ABC transporter substrate-binding protein [Paenibacillus sp. BIHB 4019]|uniref:ABC transporter substrate-binding protein n=1 Tax=Paenibacillus sp. BIHB 4019 TaxID=1870819 RepID=A0A1B2DIQ6_9BACL|nr:iron-hydroxamate ABC transporter substrate-binding protein [Paenibacillus sp. BIHB 4019]ANY67604.1 ABC transporter substrate-binding protein [Paenibacillus sp. BIHB 4019]
MLSRFGFLKGKSQVTLIALLALTLLLAACGGNAATNNTAGSAAPSASPEASAEASEAPAADKVVTDAMGHEVTIPGNPQRILASYLEDPVVTLGKIPVAQWTVGSNSIQQYLQGSLKDVPTIAYDLPVEAVASFSPDLIIIGEESAVQKGLYEQYAKIAPTYVLGNATNIDWRKTLLTIGDLLNNKAGAEQAIADYDQKAADAKAKIQAAVGEKSAAVFWLTQKNFYMVDEVVSSGAVLYQDLGLKTPNLVTEVPVETRGNWNPVSLEKLAELDADYIFLLDSDKQAGDTSIIDGPIWQGLPAVKAGNVIELDSSSSWLYKGKIANGQIIDDVLKAMVK